MKAKWRELMQCPYNVIQMAGGKTSKQQCVRWRHLWGRHRA